MNNGKTFSFEKLLKTPIWRQNNQNSISYKILTIFIDICCKYLPKSIRKLVFTLIDVITPLTFRLFTLINTLYISTYLITGEEKHSRENLRILYLNNEKLDPYIKNILFYKEPQYEKKGKIPLWKIQKEYQKYNPKIDAILIKSDIFFSGFFEKQDFFIIPEWVSMSLNLEKTLNKLYTDEFSYSIRREIKKASRYNYSYKISQDKDKINLFYYHMYLPYNRQKHRESAIISNYPSVRLLIELDYKLMLFKQNDIVVSGWLFALKNKRFRAKYLGILNEKTYLLKQGLGAASFYFSIKWAKEHGANVIDFGATRPFIKDGAFVYKEKWGTSINRAEKHIFYHMYALKQCRDGKGINTFFEMNPFIILEKNQLTVRQKSNI